MTDDTVWPHHELGKELSNWGRWGDDDQIGTLNFITPEKLVASAQTVRTGKTIDCGIPFDKNGPFPPGGWRLIMACLISIAVFSIARSPRRCLTPACRLAP